MKCNNCNQELPDGTTICPYCGSVNLTANDTQSYETVTQPEPSMKWYKFLVIALILGMVFNFFNTFNFFSDTNYNGYVNELYEALPKLKLVDTMNMIFSFLMVFLIGVTRYNLKNFKRLGPKLLITMYAFNFVFSTFYAVLAYTIFNSAKETKIVVGTVIKNGMQYEEYIDIAKAAQSILTQSIPLIITTLAMIVINYVYFKKRAHLFVN